METTSEPRPKLGVYVLLTYAALLVNVAGYLRDVKWVGAITPFFAAGACLFYSVLYLAPVALLLALWGGAVRWGFKALAPQRPGLKRLVMVYSGWVLLTSALQLVVCADRALFHLFGDHINGFVWNLLITPGGIDSLGGGTSTTWSFVLIVAGFVGLQAALLLLALFADRLTEMLAKLLTWRRTALLSVAVVGMGGFEQATYGVCKIRGYTPVLAAAGVFPLYMPITFNKLAKSLGMDVPREAVLHANVDSIRLRYPRKPIERVAPAKPLNVVWLVAESLRGDMLDPTIMPRTWELAGKATRFTQHYSGGNGTRMGMFAMFYGLYGCYWFPFLDVHRGPVLLDVLADANYQMEMYTSAAFSYPEFDKTIFARIGRGHLHEYEAEPRWRRDEANVTSILKFIDERDRSRPFMTFMFFESPHAKYYFPPETAIVRPYAEDINYTKLDEEVVTHIGLIKNRYINACHYLDSQFGRVFDHLAQHGLMDSTIVLVTGDHGEEFMEKGRWGHNSTFSEEQTRSPMVIWAPGRPPAVVTRMTSHLDLPATVLPLLGVRNPPEDYSLGYDLFGPARRDFTVMADWSTLAYVDGAFKAVFPMRSYRLARQEVTTKDDAPVTDPGAFMHENRGRIVRLMRDMSAFGQ